MNNIKVNDEDEIKLTCMSDIRHRVRNALKGRFLTEEEIARLIDEIRYEKIEEDKINAI